MNVISVSRFKFLFPELADMHIEDIRHAMHARNVSEALEIFDVAVGHFGIETVRGGWVDDYYQDIQLHTWPRPPGSSALLVKRWLKSLYSRQLWIALILGELHRSML